MLCDQIAVLKRDASFNESEINALKIQIKRLKKKKEKGVEYNAVASPPIGLFSPPNIDLSSSGLEEFQQPKFEGYGLRANKSVCENSSNETKKNSDAPLIEEWVSDNEDEVESPVVVEKKTVVPTIPKVDVVRPKQQEKPVRKTVRMTHSNPRRNMIPQAVLIRSGIKVVNTAKPKEASAWEDMKNINEDHFCSDGCTGSGEARVQQRKRRIQRRVQQKQKDQEDEVFGRILSAKKMKTVEGLKTAGYKVTTAGSRLLLLVKKLMLLVQVNAVRHNLMLID
ncbi:hypothetical protein Tco_1181213 [Tanacetum coccineum]